MGEVRPPFMELLNRHQGVIHRICRAYATDQADRQDLFQEVVYQLWRSYPEYRGDSSPITWVYRVALNTALTTARRRARRPTMIPLDTAPELPAPRADAALDELRHVIRRLGRVDRAILMCYLDDLSYARIAEIVGISESSVGARLTRIRTKLRHLLSGVE
jgi:RNA polymerase sigma-70 factor, ECF subfamily